MKAADTMERREGIRVSKLMETSSLFLLQEGTLCHQYLCRHVSMRENLGEHQIPFGAHIPSVENSKISFLPFPFPIFFHHLTQNET